MGLLFIAIMFLAHAAALLIDWLLLLLLVRVVVARWQPEILTEVNDAALPFVNRTLACVERMWSQIQPLQRLRWDRRIPAAVITLSLIRLLLAAVTGLVVSVG